MILFFKLIGESFRFAFSALRENRTRTLLSLLGVTIGVFIIIGVFSAVDTLEKNLQSSVDKLGSNNIYVQKWPWTGGPDHPWWRYANRPQPTMREYELLKSRMTTAQDVSFSIDIGNRTVKYLNNSVAGMTVRASSHAFFRQSGNLEISEGRYFSESESHNGSPVAVIGAGIAEGLFPDGQALGKQVSVMGRRLTVIGVFKKEGEGMLIDFSMDNIALIPINLGRNLVNIRWHGPSIIVSALPQVGLAETESELQGVMRSIRRLGPQEDDDFSLNKTTIVTAQLDALFAIIKWASAAIGAFSILVGGFSIANIMFVSVKERTHIIGIQKSLGAKNYFILSQFLIEAMVLCLIGGMVGLSAVYLLATVANWIFDMGVSVDTGMVILTVVLSTAIGLIAGIVPAVMGARMDPVEAIRSK